MVSAKDKYEKQSKKMNELWQTDFSHLNVQPWSWKYLSTVLGDYSPYILAGKLSRAMASGDVQDTLELVLVKTDLEQVIIRHIPDLNLRTKSVTISCWSKGLQS
jgi:hypothetical protein